MLLNVFIRLFEVRAQMKYGIICLDDEPIINAVTSFQLNTAIDEDSHYVECFTCPVEALAELQNFESRNIEVSVCVVDFQMPEMNGDVFVRKVKELLPSCRIIMLSGNSSASIVSDLVDDNMIEFYIDKPWNKEELIKAVDQCLPLSGKIL